MSKRKEQDAEQPTAEDPGLTEPSTPASVRARQLGSMILEVLAGIRTPQEAAASLGLSAQRYYTLEARAVEGMVTALEPRPRGGGRRKGPDKQLAELKAECERLERELRRANSLVRVARRAIKLPAPPSAKDRAKAKKTAKTKGKRGPRRPAVRARKLARKLREQPDGTTTSAPRKEAS